MLLYSKHIAHSEYLNMALHTSICRSDANGGANLSLRPPCRIIVLSFKMETLPGIDPNRFLNAVLHLLANPETVLSRPFENPLPHEEW